MKLTAKLILMLFSLSVLTGCLEKDAKEQTPDAAAIEYFNLLYTEKNVKKVMASSSPRMARIIKSYGTARSVQKHLVNLRYDKVEISVDSNASKVRSAFAKKSKVLVVFKGYYQGDRIDDIRDVYLIKPGDKWLVDKIEEGTMK